MALLLAASYFFYLLWDLRILGLLMASTGIDYFCARSMVRIREGCVKILCTTLAPIVWLGGCGFLGQSVISISPSSLIVTGIFPVLFAPMPEWIRSLSSLLKEKGWLQPPLQK
jgi:hypothetical protein